MSVWNSSNVYGEEIRFYFPFLPISRIKSPPNTILKAPRVSEDGGAFGMHTYSVCKVLGRHSFLKPPFQDTNDVLFPPRRSSAYIWY